MATDLAQLSEMLESGARTLGVSLSPQVVGQFMVYLHELKAWNARMNLTAIETDEDVITRHFLDSLTPYRFLDKVTRLLDAGAGAGFPGIPLKIVLPNLRATLVDSVSKKVLFMRHIIRTIGLGPDIEAIATRLEDKALVKKYAGLFDCVISRAFTNLPDFLEMSQSYLAPGGVIIAMKGPKAQEELAGFKPGGFALIFEGLHEVKIPFSDRRTSLLVFRRPL